MTTPYERTRALVETRKFLEQLSGGRLTSASLENLQNAASALLRHFPEENNLRLSAKVLPLLWAEPGAARD
jgi:RNA:NAD 2'-phosphotransferase (TPT1/KptA family)